MSASLSMWLVADQSPETGKVIGTWCSFAHVTEVRLFKYMQQLDVILFLSQHPCPTLEVSVSVYRVRECSCCLFWKTHLLSLLRAAAIG